KKVKSKGGIADSRAADRSSRSYATYRSYEITPRSATMELKGKTIAILVEQQYQELEVWYPYYRLKEAGATVVLVGPEAGKTDPRKPDSPAKSDRSAKDVSAADFAAVVAPGGFAPDYFRRDPETIRFVKDMHTRGRVVAAICHGPWLLCSTGALKGK